MEKIDPNLFESSSSSDTEADCGVGFSRGPKILSSSNCWAHLHPEDIQDIFGDNFWNYQISDRVDERSPEIPRTHSAIFDHQFDDVESNQKFTHRKFQSFNDLSMKEIDLYSIRANSWREVVLDQVLNVENLDICEFKYNLQPQDHLYLPSVKTFSWHPHLPQSPHEMSINSSDDEKQLKELKDRRTALKIMQAAPHLERINNFNFDTDYFIVIQADKVHAIKQLCLFDTVNPYHLLEFVKARPKLESLELKQVTPIVDVEEGEDDDNQLEREKYDKVCYAVHELLLSTWHTLQILDLSQFCSSLDIQLPVFPRLNQLIIGNSHKNDRRLRKPSQVFPRHIHLDKIFPNLQVFDCSRLESHENSNYELYFPSESIFKGHLNSVKVLIVSDGCTHYWMDKLENICPNFKKLVVVTHGGGGEHKNLAFMLLKIFSNWHQLEELEIRIESLPPDIDHFCLDSAFTGLREQICEQLRVNGPSRKGYKNDVLTNLEKHRVRPSIASLKNLKNLRIILDHQVLSVLAHQVTEQSEWSIKPFSFVSAVFGFQLIPKLNVTILFDRKCPWGEDVEKKIKSLLPYVNLKQRHDSNCQRNCYREKGHDMKSVKFHI